MSKGVFNVPIATNEPVKSYTKGSKERVELLNTYKEMYNSNLDIPLYIGDKEIFTKNKQNITPPHDHKHQLGEYHIANKNQPNAVGAIGHIDVYPNSRNIIPGQIICTVDMRTHLLDILDSMVAEFEEKAPKLCSDIGVDFECSIVGQFNPPAFDEGCVSAVREAAEELGYSHMDIVSGAGHDACWINKVAPTAMVMCPCVDGLSHNEAEDISQDWAVAGSNVLFHAVLETAEIVD